jgi:hypothetical protein
MDNNIKESNLERFQNLVYSDDLDIVCVNETWLSGHVYNAEIRHSGYCIVRKDRKTGGEVVSCWELRLLCLNLCAKSNITTI